MRLTRRSSVLSERRSINLHLMMAAALFSAVLVALMASAAGVAGSRDLLQGCTTLDAPFTNLIRTGDTVVGTNEFGLGMHIDEKYQRIHVTISEVGKPYDDKFACLRYCHVWRSFQKFTSCMIIIIINNNK